MTEVIEEQLRAAIRNIPDFPKQGIQFKDITTLLKKPDLYSSAIDLLSKPFETRGITKVAGIEARGFILGGALAAKLQAGFVPVRKPGKLPAAKFSYDYQLEYGNDGVEIHTDAFDENDVVLLHDDLLATGGTADAAVQLLKKMKVKKVYFCFLCELDFLHGREKLKDFDVFSLIHY